MCAGSISEDQTREGEHAVAVGMELRSKIGVGGASVGVGLRASERVGLCEWELGNWEHIPAEPQVYIMYAGRMSNFGCSGEETPGH